ncbi:serine hydrolase domain-containing protein [Streptodolium elevatio]|uniref:Serine hydrolase domain-containing protein n=1 Tax=Streptodolium elevatio TaxID=3157996 RepID=A0ABV3DE12_9ACTN
MTHREPPRHDAPPVDRDQATGTAATIGTADILADLVQASPGATAVTLAAIHDGRSEVLCHGREFAGGAPATPATAYEVGSVTKTFTALLLADSVARGEVRLSDPVDAYLPAGCRPRVAAGGPMTLLHLATHTSGLPRLPPGLAVRALPNWSDNPYAAFSDDQFRAALPRTRVTNRPGSRVRYSNYGVALLGRLLAGAAGRTYPELLAERVCRPLGLTATGCAPDPVAQAVGHRRGRPLPPWRIPGLPAAGALRSTGDDMLRYLAAHLTPTSTPQAGALSTGALPTGAPPMADALREVRKPRLSRARSGDELCLVWNSRQVGGQSVVFHAGATRGFVAFLGFAPQSGTALAAMTNTGPTLTGAFVQTAYSALRGLMATP